jgi:DNA-binding transcriptional regulator YiaG
MSTGKVANGEFLFSRIVLSVNLYRSPAQARFHQLKEQSRMKVPDIAVLLGVDKSAVYRWLSDDADEKKRRDPPEAVLELFAIKLQEAGVSVNYGAGRERIITPDDPEVEAATSQLRELHEKNPAAFKAVTGVIQTFYGKPSSKLKQKARSLAKTAAEKVSAASQAAARKP